MSEKITTSNGFEIEKPTERLSATEFQALVAEKHGLNGETPRDRMEQLKKISPTDLAIMLDDINKGTQGSQESLEFDGTMKIGDQETLDTDGRYDVFMKLAEDIHSAPESTSAARVGDTLALGVTLLHPFKDGNGRTARLVGSIFRESFGTDAYEADHKVLSEPRDIARERGGFMISGYIPRFKEGFDQSNPDQVSDYLSSLLTSEQEGAYISPYGQAPLHDVRQ